ncbi:hypothetical protein [Dietzia psychralcaliphila]|uniref:Uncharacterized protein n=1 Tax=Dietzia psychralcaliphila TaxID=139021 RepID=A0AAD0NR08_9ACTN|nr:hypothetical protein [Dietzia psychralcaliphila]AWH96674.1 hypothetical protein A6048_15575 [Dietzia psychralcaliphila]PTM89285.1 hypothetical protein C8N39_102127 [Dietzia psychralcaliphila]
MNSVPPEPDGRTTRATRTVAVLGARDSAAPAVAEALTAAAGQAPADRERGIRVLVDAGPDDRPDAAVLVVDAVCPIRPDDLEVARGVAARVPLAVALAGGVGTCDPETLSVTLDVTTRRLADAGVAAPVRVMDADPASAAALLEAVLDIPVGRGMGGNPSRGGGTRAPGTDRATTPDSAMDTVDWLLARRTEAITSRSQSLRQDVQALRMEVVQDLHRSMRDLGSRAREELAAAPRSRVDGIVRALASDADTAVAGTIARADRRADSLVARHLGAAAPVTPRIPAPTGGITPGRPPRNLGEESLVMMMGAAGGTGVGRMLLSPLSEVPGLATMVIPLALLCGVALGWTTVAVRRTQTLRTHTASVVTERLAALRSEVEQSLGARILAAEATITDGFAHDPGPRVGDLERRIRRSRLAGRAPAPAPRTTDTVAGPSGTPPPALATSGSPSP